MLFLSFQLGGESCAFPARDVVEVVPLVTLRPVVAGPSYLSGVFDYRGRVVPVIDLCRVTLGRPARTLLSTRILVVRLEPEGVRLVGLLAEGVTDTVERDEGDFGEVELSEQLVELTRGDLGLIQRLRLERLLPEGAPQEIAESVAGLEPFRLEPEDEDAELLDRVLATLDSPSPADAEVEEPEAEEGPLAEPEPILAGDEGLPEEDVAPVAEADPGTEEPTEPIPDPEGVEEPDVAGGD